MVRLFVSGKAFSEALDPRATEFKVYPVRFRPVGKGLQAIYDVPEDVAEDIYERLKLVGESFAAGDDNETRADGRACLKAAAKVRLQIDNYKEVDKTQTAQ